MSAANVLDTAVYRRLLAKSLPRVIHTKEENERCIAELEELHSVASLSTEQERLAELLLLLIERFEERYEIEPSAKPLDVVKLLMDQHGLKQADMLEIFKTKSLASGVLSGKRELSKAHITSLSRRFHVSPEVFFPI